ncbi:DUF1488 family protein [Ralstonia solanacearum]|uniref:DUF1488 domain-containing protein n=1 Tax=Ralstonia solanacearum TaxID=305 RepID=A0AAE3NHI4_RALSL|nr:DUF1488 family protein [Ralstonia solanacearum]MBB6581628.1 DUF1488 domain-containing protein [Ralstonia solanacearum]MDB0523792.1 DUF1488 domain-containing protein [Ralstonia solanacearum]
MAYDFVAGSAHVVDGDVRFSLMIDGREQRYVVSREALDDHFSPTRCADDPIATFVAGRDQICEVAAAKIGAGVPPAAAIILVGTFDF